MFEIVYADPLTMYKETTMSEAKQNDIHGMTPATPRTRVEPMSKSYSIRDLISELMRHTEDFDSEVTVQFLNCDPIVVGNIDFEENRVILKGTLS